MHSRLKERGIFHYTICGFVMTITKGTRLLLKMTRDKVTAERRDSL